MTRSEAIEQGYSPDYQWQFRHTLTRGGLDIAVQALVQQDPRTGEVFVSAGDDSGNDVALSFDEIEAIAAQANGLRFDPVLLVQEEE